MTVHCTIIEQFMDLFLVRVGHDFHVVIWDQCAEIVKAVYSGDRVKGIYLQAPGFSSETIRAVTKGRKKETATAYFNELRRRTLRSSRNDGQYATIK